MLTLLRVIILDILLAAVYLGFDVYLVYYYFSNGHVWWGGATITAVLLPGLLEFLVYTFSFLHGDLKGSKGEQIKEYLLWTIFSIFYPISLIAFNVFHICKGEANFQRYEVQSRSQVLASLSALTKSAFQLVLQSTILMITWSNISTFWRIYILTSAIFASIMLAKATTDHHFFESSAKNVRVRPPYSQRLKKFFMILIQIFFRGFVISFLAGYMQFLSLAFIGLMVLINYIAANILLSVSNGSKHFLTAAAAVVVPTCFVSRDDLVDMHPMKAKKLFTRFYKWNSVFFFLIFGVAALATTDVILLFTELSTFTCSNMPFLSYDSTNNCPENSSFTDNLPGYTELSDVLPPLHIWFFTVGNLVVFLLSLIQLVFTSVEERCCQRKYEPVNPM